MKLLFFRLTALFILPLSIWPSVHAETGTGVRAPVTAEKPWLYVGSDIPVDTSWTFGTLPNGLRYAVKHNDVPAGQVAIRVRIDAGSLHEEDDEQGYAHLIEHLSFRGSKFVPDGEAKRIWQRFGVSFGSDSNAQTTSTQTVYKLDLPSATPQALDESVKILSGMMRAPRISTESVDAERAIVLAELREGASAQSKMGDALRAHLFQGQRLANRSTIGTPETLKNANVEKLTAFHKRWYRPENTVIVMAGDVSPERLIALIEQNFTDWRGVGPLTPEPDFGIPTTDGQVGDYLAEPTLQNEINIAYLRPWHRVDDTIAYNEQLLIDALATQIVNRRLENVARRGGKFLFAGVAQEDFARSADLTIVSIGPVGDDWQAAVQDVRSIIADAINIAPSSTDIERETQLFSNAIRTRLDSYPFEAASKQADDIVAAVDIRETVAAPQTVVDVFDGMRDKLTPQRLLDATRNLFKGSPVRIMMSTPRDLPGLRGKLAAALEQPVAARDNARLSQQKLGFEKLPKLGKPGTVVSTEKIEHFDLELVRFSNDVRAILSPNKAESGQVRLVVRFGNGLQAVASPSTEATGNQPQNQFWVGEFIIGDNGIGDLNSAQIDQMINGRRIELSFRTDDDAFEFSSTTRTEDLADQLQIIATKMEYPGWDGAPVIRAKALAKQGYDGFEMSTMAVLQRDLEYLLSDRDPRWKSPDPSEIDMLTPKSFRAFWEPLMKSGSIEITIFGDFDRDETITALQDSFGAMKARPEAVPPAAALVRRFPAGSGNAITTLTHKGPTDQAAAIIAWPTGGGMANITESRQLEVLAAIFRDRLFEKFRSEQAVSYSPDMRNFWPETFDNGGYLMAYSQTRPEDSDRFLSFAQQVADDLSKHPVSSDELQRAIEPIKQSIERASTGNSFWLNQLKGGAYNREKIYALGHLLADYTDVDAVTLQQLSAKYFRAENAWKLVVRPQLESGAEQSR